MTQTGDDSDSPFYDLDNIHLLSVGIDVGTSTSQLMFSRLHLQRLAVSMSSRFELVDVAPLWYSEVVFTPYLDGDQIDASALRRFVASCHERADVRPADIDTGAVILTGEALKKKNARDIADALAADVGDFVCVSAGHHLEAMLSAHGSGSVDLSRRTGSTILCVDIGGGTTKLSLIRSGRVEQTAAIAIGARLVSWADDRRLVRVADAALALFPSLVEMAPGDVVTDEYEKFLATEGIDRILAAISNDSRHDGSDWFLTEPLSCVAGDLDALTFSGGVAEYVYGRETRGFGDLGRALGGELRRRIDSDALPVPTLDPGPGIRATVVGVGQCSVQVSGSTLATSGALVLPLTNVPVVKPGIAALDSATPTSISEAIQRAVAHHNLEASAPRAIAIAFDGYPMYDRLSKIAEGIALVAVEWGPECPIVVIFDRDIAMSVGRLLVDEQHVSNPLLCLDHIDLKPFDFIDVGRLQSPAGVVPVVIKSLVFNV